MIRRPEADVFIAFVDPLITSKFWFAKGSDRLHMGKTVRWEWEMYDLAVDIDVMAVDENRRILIHWPGEGGPTRVERTFISRLDETTFVSITAADSAAAMPGECPGGRHHGELRAGPRRGEGVPRAGTDHGLRRRPRPRRPA